MARRKQLSPMQRIPSGEVMESLANGAVTSKQKETARKSNFKWSDGAIAKSRKTTFGSSGPGTIQLVVCVAGIYASLYALPTSVEIPGAHSFSTVYPGLSCKSALPKLPTIAILPYTAFPIRRPNISAFPSSSIRFSHSLPPL